MKKLLLGLLTISCFTAAAQNKITKYYDAHWVETPKEKATFYADFVKEGTNYNCTSYWMNTRTIRGKSTYADTVMQLPIGLQVLYFKNGKIEDSSVYDNKGVKFCYRYYPNNQLAVHYYLPKNKKEGIADAYDESGKKIRNYVFFKEAEFKGGPKAWMLYISKNATKDFSAKGTSDTATVEVEFIVDENGDVIRPHVKQSSGYKYVDNDALQVIGNSPRWKNAILYNQPVKAYRKQPLIYVLKDQKK